MATGKYARHTKVPVAQSRGELEALLEKYGAEAFAYSRREGMVQIGFEMKGLRVRLDCKMPLPSAHEFTRTPTGMVAAESTRRAQFEQAERQVWRALVLVVRAKLEAVEIGISTIEREFLADVEMPNGETVGETLAAQLDGLRMGLMSGHSDVLFLPTGTTR